MHPSKTHSKRAQKVDGVGRVGHGIEAGDVIEALGLVERGGISFLERGVRQPALRSLRPRGSES